MRSADYRLAPGQARYITASLKGLKPPEGGWTQEAFREHGRELITTLAFTAKVVQRKAQPTIIRVFRSTLRIQTEQVCEFAVRRAGRRGKADAIEISGIAHQDLWAEALREVITKHDLGLTVALSPAIQSVYDQGWSKTGLMLGTPGAESANAGQAARARVIATRIRNINDTTRRQFEDIIRGSIADGHTVVETANLLREKMPQIGEWRSRTIARTETMLAWTEGSVASMQQSVAVVEVDVIGCESREEEAWGRPSFAQFMYRGEGTCNIKGVPIADADKLNFHPNHTGVIVPSKFREADGSHPDLGSGLPVTGVSEEARSLRNTIAVLQKSSHEPGGIIPSQVGLTGLADEARKAFSGADYVEKVKGAVDSARARLADMAPGEWGAQKVDLKDIAIAKPAISTSGLLKEVDALGEPVTASNVPVLIRRKGKLWAENAEQIGLQAIRGETSVSAVIIDAPRKGMRSKFVLRTISLESAPKGNNKEGLKLAFDVFDKVVELPKEAKGTIGEVPLKGGILGVYQGFGAVRLASNNKASVISKAETALHEFGHWIDELMSKVSYRLMHQGGSAESVAIKKVFRQTKAFQLLMERYSGPFQKYATSAEEVWARAFSQYAAEVSGNAELLQFVEGQASNGYQWSAADFALMREYVKGTLEANGISL